MSTQSGSTCVALRQGAVDVLTLPTVRFCRQSGLRKFCSSRGVLCLLLLAVSSTPAVATPSATHASLSRCVFHQHGKSFKGICGPSAEVSAAFNGQIPLMTLAHATAITGGVWSHIRHPVSVWTGDMTDRGYPNAALALEIYAGKWGILRTEYGWFPVTHFASSPSTMTFDINASREIAPNLTDRQIVRRAMSILSTPAAWNRAENRNCPANATTWSIYCAMKKATIEVTGGFDHRRPALEIVREIIDERTAGRHYHHRLMDYNNDPTTRLSDVQSLFKEALGRMQNSTWLRKHGFVWPTGKGTFQPG